jgi:hypothetical protein
MNVARDFTSYSEAEIQRWLHLRAIEWCAWPVFLSQPLIPVLLIFYPALPILIAVVVADILWRFVRYSFVSPRLASIGANFVIIFKWPCAIGAAIYLGIHEHYVSAALAFLWPVVASGASLPGMLLWALVGKPTLVGAAELELAKRIGYVSPDATLFPEQYRDIAGFGT